MDSPRVPKTNIKVMDEKKPTGYQLDELEHITNALVTILDEIHQLKSYVEQKTYKEIVKKLNKLCD